MYKEYKLTYDTKNNKEIPVVYLADIDISSNNSDVGIKDGSIEITNGNFCYEKTGRAVGSIVEKYLWHCFKDVLEG